MFLFTFWQVVSLGCLDRMTREGRTDDIRLLRYIDTLDIKELYVKRNLAKVYPRSSRVITAGDGFRSKRRCACRLHP